MAGLITVTLQIAYLPHLYAAFNRRENEIALLNSRAGMPSWGPELLARTHYALGSGTSAPRARPAAWVEPVDWIKPVDQGVTIAKTGSGWSVNPAMMSKTRACPTNCTPSVPAPASIASSCGRVRVMITSTGSSRLVG
jgi:hypothetical protein